MTIDARFDADGILISTAPNAASSGKLFVEGIEPRRIDEYMIGTARQFGDHWAARLYGRFRKGSHFWEDTNNTARTSFQPPDELNGETIPRELYIPDLSQRIQQIGSGSTYVICLLYTSDAADD